MKIQLLFFAVPLLVGAAEIANPAPADADAKSETDGLRQSPAGSYYSPAKTEKGVSEMNQKQYISLLKRAEPFIHANIRPSRFSPDFASFGTRDSSHLLGMTNRKTGHPEEFAAKHYNP